jgi:predicted O-methyltransferase YrrM
MRTEETSGGRERGAAPIRELIDQLVEAKRVTARSDGSVRNLFPTSIGPREGEALRGWVEREHAAVTLETGMGFGLSALFICEGLLRNGHERPRHVAIDPFQVEKIAGIGLQVIEDAGLGDVVEFHEEESQIALPRFVAEGRRFDFAFVDGNHRFDGVFLDLVYLGRLVRPSGTIFVDDVQLPAVARAVSFCTTNLEWTMEEKAFEDENHHWAVLRTPRDPIDRPFHHYVDF